MLRVSVVCRGLTVGEMSLVDCTSTTGFLLHPEPLPFGTEVTLAVAGQGVRAVVQAVHEVVVGRDLQAGMVIAPFPECPSWWPASTKYVPPLADERHDTEEVTAVTPDLDEKPVPAPARRRGKRRV